MEAVWDRFEHPESLDSGRNPAQTFAVEASNIAPTLRYRRLNSTMTEQAEPPAISQCTN